MPETYKSVIPVLLKKKLYKICDGTEDRAISSLIYNLNWGIKPNQQCKRWVSQIRGIKLRRGIE